MKRTLMILGIVMLVGGVVGFVAFTELNKGSLLPGTPVTGSVGEFSHAVDLGAGDSHRVTFWIEAEQGESAPGFATAECVITLEVDGETIAAETLQASSSEARGGVKRAGISLEREIPAGSSKQLQATGAMKRGTKWELTVHRNLPPITNIAPGLSILAGLVGLVLVLKGRAQ